MSARDTRSKTINRSYEEHENDGDDDRFIVSASVGSFSGVVDSG